MDSVQPGVESNNELVDSRWFFPRVFEECRLIMMWSRTVAAIFLSNSAISFSSPMIEIRVGRGRIFAVTRTWLVDLPIQCWSSFFTWYESHCIPKKEVLFKLLIITISVNWRQRLIRKMEWVSSQGQMFWAHSCRFPEELERKNRKGQQLPRLSNIVCCSDRSHWFSPNAAVMCSLTRPLFPLAT